MKKITLTFCVFALTLLAVAQTDSTRVYWTHGTVGFVNVRAGAGVGYGVIDTPANFRFVHRDFNREIINGWVPVQYTTSHFSLVREGYIHRNVLRPMDFPVQMILPKESTVDAEKRAKLHQMVVEIDAMLLRIDTLYHKARWEEGMPPWFLKILYFDEADRLRKYHWERNQSDGAGEYLKIIAYYDEQGNLISIFSYGGGNCESGSEMYRIHEGRIIDFRITFYCWCCEDMEDILAEAQANEIRTIIGNKLGAKTVEGEWRATTIMAMGWGRPSLADVSNAQTLLSIIENGEYRSWLSAWDWDSIEGTNRVEEARREEEARRMAIPAITTPIPTDKEGVIINGVRWATRNVDAPGTFAPTPESFGMFYQWNRRVAWNATERRVEGWNTTTTGTRWYAFPTGTEWYAKNDPCPPGWRVPTRREIERLGDAEKKWVTLNGVYGMLFGTAPNQIFLPAVGWRDEFTGERRTEIGGFTFRTPGMHGFYWSRTSTSFRENSSDRESTAWHLWFGGNAINPGGSPAGRAQGNSVRCVALTEAELEKMARPRFWRRVLRWLRLLGSRGSE